jgi:DNA modification methylase
MEWPSDKVERTSIKSITPYARNSRTHSDEQVAQIAASIKEWGFTTPILIDTDGEIIAGHGRLLAAQRLGLEEVPTMTAKGWSEAQKRAYVIADNKLALNAGWNDEMLKIELDGLKELDFDLDLVGFSDEELAKLLQEPEKEGLTDEDDVPEAPEKPITVEGDIWVLGNHRLMCGDSTSIDAVEKLMDGSKADMVFTDPPYNIDYGNIKHPKFKVRSIENDNMSGSDFADFCAGFAASIKAFCEGCIYVFGPPAADGRIMFTELDKMFHCSTTVVWNKDQFTLGRGKYQNKYEPCWFGWNKTGASFIDDRKLTNVWDFPRPKKSDLHPTMKPVELVENAIGHASNVNGLVMDLFGGSGTTAIACEKTSRNCRLMELDPKYCDVIIKRWQDFTGKEAVNEQTGKTYAESNQTNEHG